jgi:hypothetical protein
MLRRRGHNLINYFTDKLLDKLKLIPKIMTQKINTIKSDMYNVFVEGNANNIQMARVFLIIALPVISACMSVLRF